MTPKEKAKELYVKYYELIKSPYQKHTCTKQCALIAVDEILSLSKIAALRRNEKEMELEYWQEVKQEIENL